MKKHATKKVFLILFLISSFIFVYCYFGTKDIVYYEVDRICDVFPLLGSIKCEQKPLKVAKKYHFRSQMTNIYFESCVDEDSFGEFLKQHNAHRWSSASVGDFYDQFVGYGINKEYFLLAKNIEEIDNHTNMYSYRLSFNVVNKTTNESSTGEIFFYYSPKFHFLGASISIYRCIYDDETQYVIEALPHEKPWPFAEFYHNFEP